MTAGADDDVAARALAWARRSREAAGLPEGLTGRTELARVAAALQACDHERDEGPGTNRALRKRKPADRASRGGQGEGTS
jgi:hypothetical protein